MGGSGEDDLRLDRRGYHCHLDTGSCTSCLFSRRLKQPHVVTHACAEVDGSSLVPLATILKWPRSGLS